MAHKILAGTVVLAVGWFLFREWERRADAAIEDRLGDSPTARAMWAEMLAAGEQSEDDPDLDIDIEGPSRRIWDVLRRP